MKFYKHTPILKQMYQMYKLATSNRYTIGFMEFTEDLVKTDGKMPEVHWLKDNYRMGWFADPFILRMTDDEIVVLVEEFVYKLRRGVISQVIIDRTDYSIKEVKQIINTGFHLSFPAYFKKDGKVFIYPEQGNRGGTWLYEYDEKTCIAKELCVINPNAVVDTNILDLPTGEKVQTCTTAPDYNGCVLDVYKYYDKDCPSVLRPLFHIDSPHKTARNAGLFFKVGNDVYRPAQYCENSYGQATELQKLVFNDKGFSLQPVRRLYSPNKDYPDAFHTFNVLDNRWVAVDGRRKRFPMLARLLGK